MEGCFLDSLLGSLFYPAYIAGLVSLQIVPFLLTSHATVVALSMRV